jgi:putative DNA primase/helicase
LVSPWASNLPFDADEPSPDDVAANVESALRALVDEDQVIELRAIKVADQNGLTVSGFFDSEHFDEMANAAAELTRTADGVYFTLNPLNNKLLERQPNQIAVVKNAAKDNDVLRRRWLLIDADPVRPSDVSSTDPEKASARELIEKVRDELGELGWPQPVLADSGNGYHLLYRIDLPADDGGLVKRVLTALANRFETGRVKLDQKVFNPARIVKLYGTKARKGAYTEDRPHRWARLLDIPSELDIVSVELMKKLAAEVPAKPVARIPIHSINGKYKYSLSRGQIKQRAGAYVLKMPPAISGQHGHDQAFSVACKLILGFGLTVEEAFPIFKEWNETCQPPWSDKELLHKLEDADKLPEERGYLLSGHKASGQVVVDGDTPTSGAKALKHDDDPNRLAELFLERRYAGAEGTRLRMWRGDWYRWDGARYAKVEADELRGELWQVIEQEFNDLSQKSQVKAQKVTNDLVNNVRSALASIVQVPGQVDQPSWLGGSQAFPAGEMLVAKNGLVHLPSLISGEAELLNPTPALFNSMALDYDIDLNADKPHQWLSFLHGLWPDDRESVETLQEWFGYCLLPDTSQQKLLFLLGPPRSGKGTISRVLGKLIGQSNVAGPTLSSLTSQFGLWPLIGKSLAIVSDARLSGKADQGMILERILAITGEDALTIDRKNREPLTTKLPTRLMLISNELPKLSDASCALVSRMIVLKTDKSWLGSEDKTLENRLLTELPGILLWAIEGLKRLRQDGRFAQPSTGQDALDQMAELSSPIMSFVNQCCNLDPSKQVTKRDLYKSWKLWCEEHGYAVTNEATMGKHLLAAFPQIQTTRSSQGDRFWMYKGIEVRPDAPLKLFLDVPGHPGLA